MKKGIPPEVRAAVLHRDGYRCMASVLDRDAGWCKDRFDHLITRWPHHDPGGDKLEINHVKEAGKPMMGKKAPTDISHLVALCPWHHRGTKAGSNWEARNRHLLRAYLEGLD